MLVFSPHVEKHKGDIKKYLSKLNCDVDPFSREVMTFLENLEGTPQLPNKLLGEVERWRVVLHFTPCAKIRFVIARRGGGLVLLTSSSP